MAIKPYIEGSSLRVRNDASGGIDTRGIDHLRQGVSVTSRYRGIGMLPQLGSGRDDNAVEQKEFGQAVIGSGSFSDASKYDPVDYLLNASANFEPEVELGIHFDGVIEPLTSIHRADLNSITFPDEVHDVKGEIQAGSPVYAGVAPVSDQSVSSSNVPFLDSHITMGNIKLPGLVVDASPKASPFDHKDLFADITGPAIVSVLHQLSGYRDNGQRATLPHGFDFSTLRSTHGVDSLAFGDRDGDGIRNILVQRDSRLTCPLVKRTGDPSLRLGHVTSSFNDQRTVIFQTETTLDFHTGLPTGSYHTGLVSGSIVAPGIVRPGIVEDRVVSSFDVTSSWFDDSRLFGKVAGVPISIKAGSQLILQSSVPDVSSDPFYVSGSSILGENFNSPLCSKTRIEIDVTPSSKGGASMTTYSGSQGQFFPMAYYNWISQKWEGIGVGTAPYELGSLPQTLPDQAALERIYGEATVGFAPMDHFGNRAAGGAPCTNWGFPYDPKYHATSSQCLNMSAYINKPFIVEKFVYEFDAFIDSRPSSLSFDAKGECFTFFFMNQRRPYSYSSKISEVVHDRSGTQFTATSSYLPKSIALTNTGPVTFVDSIRDLIGFDQMVNWRSSAAQPGVFDDEKAERSIRFALTGSLGTYVTASFVMSGSVKSPARASKMVFLNALDYQDVGDNATLPLINNRARIFNAFGGRNGLGLPTGRDAVISVVSDLGSRVGEVTVGGVFGGVSNDIIDFDLENLRYENPYILLPTDQLVLGWQLDPSVAYGVSRDGKTFNLMPGKGRLILYGSLVGGDREYHDALNQSLASEAVHEVIGDNRVLDEWDTEPRQFFSGTFNDDVFYSLRRLLDWIPSFIPLFGDVSFFDEFFNRRVIGSRADQHLSGATDQSPHNDRIYGTSGPRRFIQCHNSIERYYDTLVPDISEYLNSFVEYGGSGFLSTDPDVFELSGSDVAKLRFGMIPFPFERPITRLATPSTIRLSARSGSTAPGAGDVFPYRSPQLRSVTSASLVHYKQVDNKGNGTLGGPITEIQLFMDNGASNVASHNRYLVVQTREAYETDLYVTSSNTNQSFSTRRSSKASGYAYGLGGIVPLHTKNIFRRDHFGQMRDMLEQSVYGKFYVDELERPIFGAGLSLHSSRHVIPHEFPVGATPSPVSVRFVSGSSTVDAMATTFSQNVSFEVTSSLPYFDGIARSR